MKIKTINSITLDFEEIKQSIFNSVHTEHEWLEEDVKREITTTLNNDVELIFEIEYTTDWNQNELPDQPEIDSRSVAVTDMYLKLNRNSEDVVFVNESEIEDSIIEMFEKR